MKFSKIQYLKQIKKGQSKMVNLDKLSDYKDMMSALWTFARVLLPACFHSGGSLSRMTLFKQFCQMLWKMKKNHGSEHLVKYLKFSHLAIQKFIAGEPVSSLKLLAGPGVYPRLANGLPKFIPLADRNLIRSKHSSIIRFYLTLYSLYRVLECKRELKLSTITNPFEGEIDDEFLSKVRDVVKSLVSDKLVRHYYTLEKLTFFESSSGTHSTSWADMLGVAISFKNNSLDLKQSFEFFLNKHCDSRVISLYNSLSNFEGRSSSLLGTLQTKDEPAGKVRVFAMVDFWTQNVLKPIHEAIFTFLRSLPNDGTFDQDLAVQRAASKSIISGKSFGYDLSAATDRLPVMVQEFILNEIFKDGFGSHWRNLLVGRDYFLDSKAYGFHRVKYSVGQPMGALSSWGMLALTHHIIVQVSYRDAYPDSLENIWFENYELLGDDIVIFDENVANSYLSIMNKLGVDINLSKSVCSPSGEVIEFAKRTVLNGQDVSGLPWKGIMSQNDLFGISVLAHSLLKRFKLSHPIAWLNGWVGPSYKVLLYFGLASIFLSQDINSYYLFFKMIEERLIKLNLDKLRLIDPSVFTRVLGELIKGKLPFVIKDPKLLWDQEEDEAAKFKTKLLEPLALYKVNNQGNPLEEIEIVSRSLYKEIVFGSAQYGKLWPYLQENYKLSDIFDEETDVDSLKNYLIYKDQVKWMEEFLFLKNYIPNDKRFILYADIVTLVKYTMSTYDIPFIPLSFDIYHSVQVPTMFETIQEIDRWSEFKDLALRAHIKSDSKASKSVSKDAKTTIKRHFKSFIESVKEYNAYMGW